MCDQVSCSRCLQKGHNIWTFLVHRCRCCLPGRLHALVCKKWILPFMAIWYLFLLPPHTQLPSNNCLGSCVDAIACTWEQYGKKRHVMAYILCVCACMHVLRVWCLSACICMYVCVWVGGWERLVLTVSGDLETIISSKSCQFVCKLWNFVTPFTCNVSCNTMKEFSWNFEGDWFWKPTEPHLPISLCLKLDLVWVDHSRWLVE